MTTTAADKPEDHILALIKKSAEFAGDHNDGAASGAMKYAQAAANAAHALCDMSEFLRQRLTGGPNQE